MIKRIRNIFFMIVLSIIVINIDNVYAVPVSDNYNPGTTSLIAGCDGLFCYSGSVGFRITLVDSTTGKRCKVKKDGDNYELCSSSGSDTKSKDYWFNTHEIDEVTNGAADDICIAYSTKETKAEHIKNNDYNSNIVSCSKYKDYKQLNELFTDYKMNDSTYGFKNWRSDNMISNARQPQNMLYVRNWFNDRQNSGNAKELSAIFKATTGYNITESDIKNGKVSGLDKANIQFEQLLLILNYHKSTGLSAGFASMGTVAEATALYENSSYKFNNGAVKTDSGNQAYRWCTIGKLSTSIQNNNASSSYQCGSHMFAGGYWTGWSNDANIGNSSYIELKKNSDATSVVSNINSVLSGKYTTSLNISNFYKEASTANIYNVKISDAFVSSCNSDAKNIANDFLDGKINKTKYIEKLKNSKAKVCFDSSGKIIDKCNILDEDILKLYGKTGLEKVPDACNVTCNSILKSITNNDTIDKINEKLKDKGYTNYMLLAKKIWELLGMSGPSCGNPEYECKPTSSSMGNCNANVVFQDSTKNGCWDKGVAYNDVTNKMDYSAFESSRDLTFSSKTCNVYCIETVSFNLPTSSNVNETKSGRIFKWGINNNAQDNLFGTMTVTRKCQAVDSSATGGLCSSSQFKPAYWVDKDIKTELKIKYREPISGKGQYTSTLKAKFDKITSINLNNTNGTVTNGNSSVYCNGGNCSNTLKSGFTVTAEYKFEYGDDLYWYSDKGKNDSLVKKEDITTMSERYVEIGYGLPTEFTTPTVTYSIYKDDNTGYDWSKTTESVETNGYLYAEITKVGTNGHFDTLIKTNAKKGVDGYFEESDKGILKYGCNYSVTNELFGTECVGTSNQPDYCNPDTSPKGIDVVFRTVNLINVSASNMDEELNKAFPGKSGQGLAGDRKIGKNWNQWLNGNPYDSTDINNNLYNILSTSVYNESPAYTIKLNSSAIKKIREYNRNARKENYDPYTYMGDVAGIENNGYVGYVCVKGSKKYAYCASEFLTRLKQDSNINFEGTCVINVNKSKDRANNFKDTGCMQTWYK